MLLSKYSKTKRKRLKTMKSYEITYAQGKYVLIVNKTNPFINTLEVVVGNLCKYTGHHMCNLYGKVAGWEYKTRTASVEVPVTLRQARIIDPEFVEWSEDLLNSRDV